MERLKISYAALDTYRNFTRKNKNETEIMLRLKLMRNWVISPKVYENEYIEVREYGNLRMTVSKSTRIMNKIYNFKKTWEFANEEKFKDIKAKAKVYDDILGINDIRMRGYKSVGFEINARAYKNYLYEQEFEQYRELLTRCIHMITNGDTVGEFNDKQFIKFRDCTGEYTITLTDKKYITNIKFERGRLIC